jgi:hypothetical protein
LGTKKFGTFNGTSAKGFSLDQEAPFLVGTGILCLGINAKLISPAYIFEGFPATMAPLALWGQGSSVL